MKEFIIFFIFSAFFIYAILTKRTAIINAIAIFLGCAMFISTWVAYDAQQIDFVVAMILTVLSVGLISIYTYMWLLHEIKHEFDLKSYEDKIEQSKFTD
jgi:hypothetical protein